MSKNFLFNAPTYFDFNPQNLNENDDTVEMYFEIDHEHVSSTTPFNCDPLSTEILHEAVSSAIPSNCDPLSTEILHEAVSSAIPSNCDPLSTDATDKDICLTTHDKVLTETNDRNSDTSENNLTLNSSRSVDDLKVDNEFSTPMSAVYSEISDAEPEHRATLRKSLSLVNLADLKSVTSKNGSARSGISQSKAYTFKRCKSTSKERINQLAQPKQNCNNYVSTAEQVNNFFRAKPNRPEDLCKKSKILTATLAQSPALRTKSRQRETHMLPTEEKEKLEMDEYRKLHMKALPLNSKIFKGPMKVSYSGKKPATIVRPFNLTETNAEKPMQKHLELAKSNSQTTKLNTTFKPAQTRPVPFSFESRDKELAKRRQQKINEVLEGEMKARKFRANPPPKYNFPNGMQKSCSLNSLRSNKSEDDSKERPKPFKAKPPTVLYQKPFELKKSERPLVEVTEFCLNTERRIKDREEYDKKVQEARDRLAIERAIVEERQARYEKEEIAKLRKELIQPAHPIRHYKEVKIKSSGKVTVPISPNFTSGKRSNSYNKEN